VADVTIVQVEVTVLVLGVTMAGLNEHVADAGNPSMLWSLATAGQVSVTGVLKFPKGAMLMTYEAVLPAVRVTFDGVAERTKLAAPTVTLSGTEVLVVFSGSPRYVAVIVG
jgi:hypothetical protein